MEKLFTEQNIALWSRLGPKKSLYYAARALLESLPESVLLTADLANRFGLEGYRDALAGRFFDAGISEAAMIGMAAGMAAEGKKPVCFGYAPFVTARVLDQLRVNLGAMALPVTVVGADAGLTSNDLGPALTALEDVAAVRSIPNMTVLCPADCTEAIKCVLAAAVSGRPAYIRVAGAPGCPTIHREDYAFAIGKARELRPGGDLTVLSNGPVLQEVLHAAERLERKGIACKVVNVSTVKPLDTAYLDGVTTPKAVVVEEHSVLGGLGSAVAEHYAQRESAPRLLLLGTPDVYAPADTREAGLKRAGLDEASLAARMEAFLRG